ncbi:hypothetical protein PBY51_021997 [Eleginops maclovinus]|uniref:C2H2-type domain-containing protein n=1 Tax=Eleginops maclovinus TaxID=56733 RepID=A0AAN7XH25_ELEMC|nr:hypothetical protein PBY51_021997 [Eleginops maclovinus]
MTNHHDVDGAVKLCDVQSVEEEGSSSRKWGGAVSSSLYCGEVGGQWGGQVEAFLVELYRCKLCQFTCSLKASVSQHLLTHRGGGSPYQLDLSGGAKQDDDDFLLYNMLISPPPGSPPPGDISGEVGHTCEVRSLFEDSAQSAHLMTLGFWEELPPHCRRCSRRGGRKQQKKKKRKKKRRKSTDSVDAQQKTPDGWSQLIGRAEGKEAGPNNRETLQEQAERKRKPKNEEKETGFCCSLCHRSFSSSLTLRRHLGSHGGEKPFSCPHCSYCSRLKASLLQHLRTHTGEKPFRCAECSYASIDRSSLLRHCRTHSQEKPYSCTHCDYSSIQKKGLDLHARRHHSGEAFPCRQCSYSSPDRQLLQRHVRRHHGNLTADPTL